MYRKRNKGWLKHLDFAVLDLMCMQICLALAYFGRHRELSRLYSDSVYQNVMSSGNAACILSVCSEVWR